MSGTGELGSHPAVAEFIKALDPLDREEAPTVAVAMAATGVVAELHAIHKSLTETNRVLGVIAEQLDWLRQGDMGR